MDIDTDKSYMRLVPPELLDRIFDNLWVVDRVRVSMVSRSFNRSIQRISLFPKRTYHMEISAEQLVIKSVLADFIRFACTSTPRKCPHAPRQLLPFEWENIVSREEYCRVVRRYLSKLEYVEHMTVSVSPGLALFDDLPNSIECHFLKIVDPSIGNIVSLKKPILSILSHCNMDGMAFEQKHKDQSVSHELDEEIVTHPALVRSTDTSIFAKCAPSAQMRLCELNARVFASDRVSELPIVKFIHRWFHSLSSLSEAMWVVNTTADQFLFLLLPFHPEEIDQFLADQRTVLIKRRDGHVAEVTMTHWMVQFIDLTSTEKSERRFQR